MNWFENDGFDVGEFLEESQERERQRLEKELQRIERQLEERDQVHSEIVDELEGKLDWYLERLETLYKQMRGRSGEREKLKTSIEEFYSEIRNEKRRKWRDKVELERELRNLEREMRELSDDDLLYDLLK